VGGVVLNFYVASGLDIHVRVSGGGVNFYLFLPFLTKGSREGSGGSPDSLLLEGRKMCKGSVCRVLFLCRGPQVGPVQPIGLFHVSKLFLCWSPGDLYYWIGRGDTEL